MILKEFQYQENSTYPKTLNSFLDYLCSVRERSQNTVDKYGSNLEEFLKYIKIKKGLTKFTDPKQVNIRNFSDTEIRKITLKDIEDYLVYCKKELGNSAATRSNKISSLDTFYRFLMKEHIVDKNIIDGVERPKLKKTEPDYFTLDEVKKLFNTIKNSNKEFKTRDYAIIVLFLNTGMRISELIGLDLQDIDMFNEKLLALGKGNKERELDLTLSVLNAINDYLPLREKMIDRKVNKEDKALFISRKGNRIDEKTISQMLKWYAKESGLDVEKAHPHALRHTAGTLIYSQIKDIRTLQEILGHTNISTTQIYTHINSEQKKKAINSNPLADL